MEALYKEKVVNEKESWLLEVDNSSAVNGSVAGIAMTSLRRIFFSTPSILPSLHQTMKLNMKQPFGLRMCIAVGAKRVSLKTESLLVNRQLKGEFGVR